MAGRAATKWRWASVNDSADMGDLPVWADRPRARGRSARDRPRGGQTGMARRDRPRGRPGRAGRATGVQGLMTGFRPKCRGPALLSGPVSIAASDGPMSLRVGVDGGMRTEPRASFEQVRGHAMARVTTCLRGNLWNSGCTAPTILVMIAEARRC